MRTVSVIWQNQGHKWQQFFDKIYGVYLEYVTLECFWISHFKKIVLFSIVCDCAYVVS